MNISTLVEYRRAGLREIVKYGSVSWVHGDTLLHSLGDNTLCYGRSTLKPLHLKVFKEDLKSLLSLEEKALSVSSHNAEATHLHVLDQLLKGTDPGDLQVPAVGPHHKTPQQEPSVLFHPCSGEHAALLKGCKVRGWDLKTYTSPRHPYYQAFLSYLRKTLGANWHPEFLAKDGCGLLTVSVLLNELASLFASLVRERNSDWIWEAMTTHPFLVGGSQRLDSTIMKVCKKQVLAKEGADGLLALAVVHEDYPQGLGIIIKLHSGYDSQAMWFIARAILSTLGWELPFAPRLHRQEVVLNPQIVPLSWQKQVLQIPTRDPEDAIDDTFE